MDESLYRFGFHAKKKIRLVIPYLLRFYAVCSKSDGSINNILMAIAFQNSTYSALCKHE